MKPSTRPHQQRQSTNLYSHLKAKPKKSKAAANIDNTIQPTNEPRNVQCMDHPETILGHHLRLEAQGSLLPITAHAVEHHIGQPPQLGCKTHGLPPEDTPLLPLRQLRHHTGTPDTTCNTTTLGVAGAWSKIGEFKPENPVAEQDKPPKDKREMTPDMSEPCSLPHKADDHPPGPIYSHQGMRGTTLEHVQSKPDLPMTTRPNSRRDSTCCYSPARPPEDDANEPAPERMNIMSARSPVPTTSKAATIDHAASRKPNINGTYNANGKVIPLLKHISYAHPAELAPKFSPTSYARSLSNPPATPSRPLSAITHSKKSTRLATSRNPFKSPKPRHAFRLQHAKIRSTPLQLHVKFGTAASFYTNFNIKRAYTQHHQRVAKLLHSYITLAAATKPHHTRKIRFLIDCYPHAPETSTQFSVIRVFNNTISTVSHQNGKPNNMADNMNRNGSDDCYLFHDGTKPLCGVKDQLGHECQQCLRQSQTAQELLGSVSPRTRRMLLRRENRNLQLVRRFTDMQHRLIMNENAAWHEAIAAKEAAVAMMREGRRQLEEQQE